jgi:hypothetical protein
MCVDLYSKRSGIRWRIALAAALLSVLASLPAANAGSIDICGCADSPASLGDFRTSDAQSYPPKTSRTGTSFTIRIPIDGRFIFNSFILDGTPDNASSPVQVRFIVDEANDSAAANVPVRLLVAGDVTIPASSSIDVSGFASAGASVEPRGGIAGPGGFRGGDGANEQTLLSRSGGYGLGPGGGRPGDVNAADRSLLSGHDGTFVGNNQLVPLIGGGGGGGGSTDRTDCSGGAGGGGGGAILIAANGTIALNGSIMSLGGGAGGFSCQGVNIFGGSGSGGAVRLVADTIAGMGQVYTNSAQPGRIRLEAFDISPQLTTYPAATRALSPAPESAPQLAIVGINGESESRESELPIADRPQGVFGKIDVTVSGAEPVTVDLMSDGLTGGTMVEVSAKGRNSGQLFTKSTTLGSCSQLGQCTATAVFSELPSGTYFIEAKALFQ